MIRRSPVLSKGIRIGKLSVLLKSTYAPFWKFADRRYQHFYTEHTPRCPDDTIDHRVTSEASPGGALPRATSIVEENGLVRMVRAGGVATWDREGRRLLAEQPEQDFDTPYPDYVVDSAIRIIFSYRLLDQDGLLLHAAGVVRDGQGYLFVGESNAGKSTVARCSATIGAVLSDDLTIAYMTKPSGSIFGTPFFGEFSTGVTNTSAPIAGIYFLRKATINKCLRLDSNQTVTRLLKSVMFFGHDVAAITHILRLATEFSARVPCYELQFLPNASFWRCLDADSHTPSQ